MNTIYKLFFDDNYIHMYTSHIQIKIKILHILHWHLGPSLVIIKLLKDKISVVFLISFGNKFQMY